jgi:PKD repeat protein
MILVALTLLMVVPALQRPVSAASTNPIIGIWSPDCFSSVINTTNCAPFGVNLPANSIIHVQVNVTNPPPNPSGTTGFNAFEFSLFFDPTYIQTAGDDTSNTLCPNAFFAANDTDNVSGRLHVVVAQSGGYCNLNNLSSGPLLNVRFVIVKVGVSPIVLAAGMTKNSDSASSGDWTELVGPSKNFDVQTSDGYFSNTPTRGPVAVFTFSPGSPAQGLPVRFDATGSYDPGGTITDYFWDFGDGTSASAAAATNHTFATAGGVGYIGNFSVRLTVGDRNSLKGMKTALVDVSQKPFHDIEIQSIIPSATSVKPGDKVSFSVVVKNGGTFTETYNLTVTYGPPTTLLKTYLNQSLGSIFGQNTHAFTFTWDTTGLNPQAYTVIAKLTDPLAQNTLNLSSSIVISVNVDSSSPLLLIALGAIAAAVIIVAAGLFLRRRNMAKLRAQDAL